MPIGAKSMIMTSMKRHHCNSVLKHCIITYHLTLLRLPDEGRQFDQSEFWTGDASTLPRGSNGLDRLKRTKSFVNRVAGTEVRRPDAAKESKQNDNVKQLNCKMSSHGTTFTNESCSVHLMYQMHLQLHSNHNY